MYVTLQRVRAETCAISVIEYPAREKGDIKRPWRMRQHIEKETTWRRTKVPNLGAPQSSQINGAV